MLKRLLAALAVCCAAVCMICPTTARSAGADEYRIEVDIANQIATVFRRADGSVQRQMVCSTGAGDATPRGTFRLQKSRAADRSEWYFIGKYQCFVKYPTRIQGSILFHSLPYSDKDMDAVDPLAIEQLRLGEKASHGCVRLRWEDAQWIAQNCPDGTETRIFTGVKDESALRALLYEGGFSADSGVSYDDFTAALRGDRKGTLCRGDAGEAVEALQRRLGKLGFFAGKATGEFDSATAFAVMRYQSAQGLSPTGFATPALVAKIMMEN